MGAGAADAVLQELGGRIGLPGLRLDDAGCCQLAFDGRWLVTVVHQPSAQRLLLHCPIGAPDALGSLDKALLLTLLEANFMGRGVGRGTLALAPDRRPCVQLELPLATTDAAALNNAIELLLNLAESWAGRLLQPAASAGRPAGGAPWMGQRV